MANTLGLYTITAGSATLVQALESAPAFQAVEETFNVTPGVPKTVLAADQRRYAGARPVGEQTDNGEVGWTCLVKGTTSDDAITKLGTFFGAGQQARTDLYLGLTLDGASKMTFWHVRGTPTFSPSKFKWAQWKGAHSWAIDVRYPVAPLPREAAVQSITLGTPTLPATIALGTAIGGDAPALADVGIRHSGGSAAPVWALIAWIKRITGTPIASSVAPWGIIEAESYTTVSTWAKGLSDATYRGSDGIRTTASGVGTASATWALDPSVMTPDDWVKTIDIEFWARLEIAAALVSPKLTLSASPANGLGVSRYTPEYGAAGKLLTKPASGTVKRFVRLGVLTFPVEPDSPLVWTLKLDGAWGSASSGSFGVDYLMAAPVASRALLPTGKVLDSTFPKFISSTADTTKLVRHDLSATVAAAANNGAQDSGLGGRQIWLPPGNVDMLIKLSSLVPDDPTSDTSTEQLSHTLVSGSALSVVNRYWLAAH